MVAANDSPSGTADSAVIEWAPFRVRPDVTEATLLDASEALQRSFLADQPGFVRRELLRGANGEWVDLVYWRDEASANAVISAVAASPACHAYFSLMENFDSADPAAGVVHLRRVRAY